MLRDERGNILVLTALCMTMLLSFMAFAVDIGNLFFTQRQLQTLADSAAMAGAQMASTCGSPNCAVLQTAAITAITKDTGLTLPSGTGGNVTAGTCAVPTPSATGQLYLEIDNGPCVLGNSTNDPNYGQTNYVEAVVAEKVPTFFAGIFGLSTVTISARAEAGKSIPAFPPCDLNLGTSGNDLNVNGGGSITNAVGAHCAVVSDSTSTPACSATVNGSVTTSSLSTAGYICDTNGGAVVPSNTKANAGAVQDPFKSLVAPTLAMASARGSFSGYGGAGSAQSSLSPGVYNGDVNFNGGTYGVTMAPGLYYFTNNVTFSNTGAITGSGVTMVFAPGATLTLNSGVTFKVTAPSVSTDAIGAVETGGAYNGMLIWVPGKTGDTGDNFILDANTASTLNGAVYVPNGQIELNGSSTVNANGSIVSNSLDVNGTLVLGCSAMPNGVCPGGGVNGGNGGSPTIALAE
jgi:hypothetical protein